MKITGGQEQMTESERDDEKWREEKGGEGMVFGPFLNFAALGI